MGTGFCHSMPGQMLFAGRLTAPGLRATEGRPGNCDCMPGAFPHLREQAMDHARKFTLRGMSRAILCCLACLPASCKYPPGSPTILSVLNELQPCEEENLHYRLVGRNGQPMAPEEQFIVLPELSPELATPQNYGLLWPARTTRRMRFRVAGHLAWRNDLPWENPFDGCVPSRGFLITEILSAEDITDQADFRIRN